MNKKTLKRSKHLFPARSEYLMDEWWEESFGDLDGRYPSRKELHDAINNLGRYIKRIQR